MEVRINGKFLDIMIEKNDIEDKNIKKKFISYRKIKNDRYILFANDAELLVVDGEIANKILTYDISQLLNETKIFEILNQNNYLYYNISENRKLPKEPKDAFFSTLRIIYILIFIFSLFSLLNLRINIILNGYELLNFKSFNFIKFILIGIIFSILTTFIHEIMHALFSNNLKSFFRVVNISLKKSTAFISLTHVWTWSLFNRLLAISAGVIIDFIIFVILEIILNFYDNEIFRFLSTIIFLRIIWQFRVNKKSDSRYFFMMLIDNPFIDIDYKNKSSELELREKYLWKFFIIISRFIELYISIFFLIPFLIKLLFSLKEFIVYVF